MSFSDLSHDPTDNVVRSAVNIANDDFDYYKYAQAFAPNDFWSKKSNKNMTNLPPGISVKMPNDLRYENQPLKSCPTVHQSRFTFDDLYCGNNESTNSKRQYGNLMTRNKVNQQEILEISPPNKTVADQSNSILKLQITGNPNYELDESDLLSIFSPFGNILRIEIAKHRMAYIVYDQIMHAAAAHKKLHSQLIKHLNIKLYLSWTNRIEEDLLITETEDLSIDAGLSLPSVSNTSKSLPNLDLITPNFSYNLAKFTCKYEVQIEGDRDFKIARKIIGPKGCNMKKIIEICQAHLKHLNNGPQGDFLKLRLRGQGSGFREGPEQRESDDVLHLCVSSKYSEVYYLACKLVESLMSGLYKEYEQFCQKAGRPLQESVQIKRVEIYGNNDAKQDSNLNVAQQDSTDSNESNDNNNVVKKSMKSLVLKSSKYSTTESSNGSLSSNSDREISTSPPRRNSIVLQTVSP